MDWLRFYLHVRHSRAYSHFLDQARPDNGGNYVCDAIPSVRPLGPPVRPPARIVRLSVRPPVRLSILPSFRSSARPPVRPRKPSNMRMYPNVTKMKAIPLQSPQARLASTARRHG